MPQIYRFVYTKVTAEKSPWKKNGFQTLYYSTEGLEKKTLLDLESRIHYPGDGYTYSKTNLSWVDIKGEKYEMIQFFTPLPHLVDEFGRKGMFMVQGFLLPEALWNLSPDPGAWVETCKKKVAKAFEDLFSLPGLDASTGNLAPLDWPAELPEDAEVYRALTAVELTALETLYRIGAGEQDLALVVNGLPDDVYALYRKLLCWLPKDYRTKTGFDTGFDSGKIFFSPLKVLGYSQNAPVTGDPVVFHLEAQSISGNAPDPQLRPFLRWVSEGPQATPQAVEDAAILSAWLLTNQSLAPEGYTGIPQGFGSANHSFIREAFSRKAIPLLDEPWAKWMASVAPPKWQLEVMLANFPAAAVAKELGAQLAKATEIPFKAPLSSHIAQQAGDLAIAVRELQQNQKISRGHWERIPEGNRPAAFELFMKYANPKVFSIWSVMRRVDLEQIGVENSPELAPKALDWIKQEVKRQGLPVETLGDPLNLAVLVEGNLQGLADKKTDWAEVLDVMLRQSPFPISKLNDLKGVIDAQHIQFSAKHLCQYIFERHTHIPAILQEDSSARIYLAANLVARHEVKDKELTSMGFTSREIGQASSLRPTGILKLLHKLFG